MSTARSLQTAVERFPTRYAVTFGNQTWTYEALWRSTTPLVMELKRRNIGCSDRVGYLISNRPEWLHWHIAVSRAGAVGVPINPAYTASEIRTLLETADLALLVIDESLAGAADLISGRVATGDIVTLGETASLPAASDEPSMAEGEGADPAVIYFSSGSTGRPKGIVHSGRNLARIADLVRQSWQLTPDDTILVAMPLAFVYASTVAWLAAVRAGASIVLQRRFDPDATARLVDAGTLTVLMGVPSMYHALLAAGPASRPLQSRLRLCLTAGDVLPRDLDEAFLERFGTPLLDFYGLTEAPHVIAHTLAQDVRTRPFSCGRPLAGVEVRIVDDEGREIPEGGIGELVCRAPFTFIEYFRNPEATGAVLRNGWFSTGDLVRQDADGYLYVIDRKKELIKRSGFNVVPGEVERVIQSVAGVDEVAVVGVPDAVLGERVRACIVRRPGADVRAETILARCRAELAKYKVPDEVEFIVEMPRGATGKIQRRALRARVGDIGHGPSEPRGTQPGLRAPTDGPDRRGAMS